MEVLRLKDTIAAAGRLKISLRMTSRITAARFIYVYIQGMRKRMVRFQK
jgi:hypothetical protein